MLSSRGAERLIKHPMVPEILQSLRVSIYNDQHYVEPGYGLIATGNAIFGSLDWPLFASCPGIPSVALQFRVPWANLNRTSIVPWAITGGVKSDVCYTYSGVASLCLDLLS